MTPSREHGFTIIEALIAGGIVTLMALTGLAACKAIANVTGAAYTAGRDASAVDTQAARLRNDAATAFAIFVPQNDLNGASNVGPEGGHEVDFYSKGDGGQEILWCYLYDASTRVLQRFDYDAHGARGVRDVATGTIDGSALYPPIEAVRAFRVDAIAADQIGASNRNLYSGVAGLFEHTPRSLGVSYDRPSLDIPGAVGGNAIVQIRLANAAESRVVHLAPGSLPTGFTVTGLPLWHAIVYRVDQTHRSGFGFFGKSHVFIDYLVEVSYDHWNTRAVWCDYNLLGSPHGLDGHDPHADYKPDEPLEQAEALLKRCQITNPTPPPRHLAVPAPAVGLATQPLPGPTPPPCWTNPGPQGRCWPADAPVDWTPPAPLPVDTPPAEWCATRMDSVACKTALPRATGP